MEFAKLLANVVYVPTCLRASLVYVLTCVRAKVPKACQLFIFTCQRSYDVALFYLGLPIFYYFSCEMLGKTSILCYYIKNSTFYLIS